MTLRLKKPSGPSRSRRPDRAADGVRGASPGPARRTWWRAGWRLYGVPYLLIAPTLICLAGVLVYPLGAVTVASLFSVEPLKHPGWVFAGLDNYRRLLDDSALAQSLSVTAIWTLASVALQFVLGMAGALILRERFRLRGLLRALLLIPWATPAVVGALAWKWIYHGQYGLLNVFLRSLGWSDAAVAWLGDPQTALGAAVVTNVWRGFPFVMIMLLSGLTAIPDVLYEAATVDGAGFWQGLRHVTMPLLRPVVLVSTLLAGIWTFNNFSYIHVLTGGGPAGKTEIMVTFVYRNAFQYFHFGYAAALSVVLFLIVLVSSVAYIRMIGAEGIN